MILNSTHIFCLIPELKELLLGHRIAEVAISSDQKEILISLQGRGKKLNLFFSSHSENCRLEMYPASGVGRSWEDFQKTNLFRYAVGSHIRDIVQVDFDRIIGISCEKRNQFGSGERIDLIFELTGRNSNLILVKQDGTIQDCLRKIDATKSRSRQILPGGKYLSPQPPKKKNPITMEREEFKRLLESADKPALEWLMSTFLGMDQLSTENILTQSQLDGEIAAAQFSEEEKGRAWKSFRHHFDDILKGNFSFEVVTDEKGHPQAITCVKLSLVPAKRRIRCASLSSAVRTFFSKRLAREQGEKEIQKLSQIARRTLKKLCGRSKRIEIDFDEAERYEEFKRFGDLLMMNKSSIRKGQISAQVTDIFDSSQPKVEIPLDPKLGAMANAQRYYKKHRKAKDALDTINKRRSETKSRIDSLKEMITRLDRVEGEKDIEDIKRDLSYLGFLKLAGPSPGKERQKKSAFRTFLTKTGWEILVGRNNRENDLLSFKVARPDDLWFHAQGVPGSHVVLKKKEKRAEPSSGEIRRAAEIAAYFSKARGEAKAEVVYTFAKYVRKPKGAKPGLALVENEKSILVKPGLPVEE
jgi:predicted ribosome quality control (RQC) complex YloA/Tae2 family protein